METLWSKVNIESLIEVVPQNMYCILSPISNEIMEVPQKLDWVGPVDNRPSTN